MSQENVAVVLRGYDAWSRGEFDSAYADADPDIEWVEDPGFPEAGTYRGREAIALYFSNWRNVFESFEVAVEETLERTEHVVAYVVIRGRIRESGTEVEMRTAHVWTFRGATVIRGQAFLDRSKALDAVGLSE